MEIEKTEKSLSPIRWRVSSSEPNCRHSHDNYCNHHRRLIPAVFPSGTTSGLATHKARNVKAHLPEKHHPQFTAQLAAAYRETNYERALEALKTTVAWLERVSPAAAASLREGLEETLTVVKLGLPELLRRTLATANPVVTQSAPLRGDSELWS